MKEFKNIKNIIFDCDGVLYKDLDAVFGQVSKRMGEYISKKLNVDLKEAKELVESAPIAITKGISKEEADNLAAKLAEINAEIEIK